VNLKRVGYERERCGDEREGGVTTDNCSNKNILTMVVPFDIKNAPKKLKGKNETFFNARKWQRPIFVVLTCWVHVVTQESYFFLIQEKTTDLLLHRLTNTINKSVIFLKGDFSLI
jgi:hypothetical protein